MENVFSAHFGGMDAFAATHHGAGATYSAAGSVDSAALLSAAALALGPIGAPYLAAFAPALNNNLWATRQLGHVHHAIGHTTASSKLAFIAADYA
jgi:hypothetical protein